MVENTLPMRGSLWCVGWRLRRIRRGRPAVVVSVTIACALLAGGCTFMRHHINTVDFHERIKDVEDGRTTTDELREMIGSPPQSVLFAGKGERIWVYSFGEAKAAGLTLIVFNTLKTNMGLDGALFLIDENGVVKEHTVSNNSQDLAWEWWPFDEKDES